eukprot:scaffold84199_cov32-Prasinocladus_malaysianus.AAC.1
MRHKPSKPRRFVPAVPDEPSVREDSPPPSSPKPSKRIKRGGHRPRALETKDALGKPPTLDCMLPPPVGTVFFDEIPLEE